MAKSFVDQKARTGIPGVPGLSKVVNQNAWGDAKAVERGYGSGTRTFPSPKDVHGPQDPVDKHGPGYDNEVPVSSWLRGGSESGKPPRGRK
jgi:hypothetical protein